MKPFAKHLRNLLNAINIRKGNQIIIHICAPNTYLNAIINSGKYLIHMYGKIATWKRN